MSAIDPGPWFTCSKNGQPARLRLFCFPYAGGSSLIYRGWQNYLPAGVSVWPVQLPGRGTRYRDTPLVSMPAVVNAVTEAIEPFLDLPFAFFGHSMGSLMSFEIAHAVREKFGKEPEHVFVSGSGGPQLQRRIPNIHDVSDEEFIAKLKEYNGTPTEVFENPELLAMMMRMLRADFQLVETYPRFSGPPLDCPISAFGGQDDDLVTKEELDTWSSQTTNSFNSWLLPGDHFFIHSSDELLFRVLTQQLRMVLAEIK